MNPNSASAAVTTTITDPIRNLSREATGRTLVRNTFANLAGYFSMILLGIASMPYIIHHFGAPLYGVLILLLNFLNMLTAFQLGLNVCLVKYTAECLGSGKSEDIKWYLASALAFNLAVGLTFFVGVTLFANHILRFFNIPNSFQSDALFSFYIIGAAVLIRFLTEPFCTIPIAAQRFDIVNYIFIGTELLRVTGNVAVVYMGYRIRAVAMVALAVNILFLVATLLAAKRLSPTISLIPRISKAHLRQMYRFTKYAAISKVVPRIAKAVDTMLLAHWLPVAYIAFYAVPSSFTARITQLVGNVTSVSYPALSSLSGANPRHRLKALYVSSSKIVFVVLGFPVVVFSVLSYKLLFFYVGPQFAARGSTVLALLCFGTLLKCLAYVPSSLSEALGHPDIPAKFGSVDRSVLYRGLSFADSAPWPRGAGYCCRRLAVGPGTIVIRTIDNLIGLSGRDSLLYVYLPVLPPILFSGLVIHLLSERITSLFALGTVTAVAGVAYVVLCGLFTFDDGERSALLRSIGRNP